MIKFMQSLKLFSIVLCLTLIMMKCRFVNERKDPYWESRKDDFKYQNKVEFKNDSALENELRSLNRISDVHLGSIFSGDHVYLYSWHGSDSSTIRFTVVHDDEEHGLDVYYLILSKADGKVIASEEIAGAGREADFLYETASKITGKDSLFQVRSVTQWLDPGTRQRLERDNGDSTFLHLTIDATGQVTEKIVKEVKHLNDEYK